VAEHGASAVHGDDRAVDETRLGREEVSDDRRYLFRSADAAEGMQAAHLLVDLLLFRPQCLVALGGDRSERDSVGPDSARPVVDGERTRESLDRRLGGRVWQRARHGTLSLVGGDVDDRARAAAGEEAADAVAQPVTASARLNVINSNSLVAGTS
jgi:hypothetical protein